MPERHNIGSVIRAERERRGLPVSELAERAGLRADHVEAIEAARREPRFTDLRAVAAGLGLRASELARISEADPEVPRR